VSRNVLAALLVESIVIAGLLTIVADQVAHTRVERLGGVNVWGYRGPVLTQKRPRELRLAVVGGDLAFGWGLAASQALAQAVRDEVAFTVDSPRGTRVVRAVTLGAIGLPRADYASWIRRYASLQPDVLLIVVDPKSHALAAPGYLPARRSVAFRRFGYSPILPLVLDERAAIRHSAVSRLAGRALAYADGLLTSTAATDETPLDDRAFLSAIERAIRAGLETAPAGVVVVTVPDARDESVDRQGVKDLVALTFAAAPVRVVDLGDDPAMRGDGLRLDGFNFSAAGQSVAARDIAPAVLGLLSSTRRE
jgi:hypothetical protein